MTRLLRWNKKLRYWNLCNCVQSSNYAGLIELPIKEQQLVSRTYKMQPAQLSNSCDDLKEFEMVELNVMVHRKTENCDMPSSKLYHVRHVKLLWKTNYQRPLRWFVQSQWMVNIWAMVIRVCNWCFSPTYLALYLLSFKALMKTYKIISFRMQVVH